MGRIFVLLLLVPLAAAQTEPGIYNPDESTTATMYFHINGFQDFPINTQKPDDRYYEKVNVGMQDHSGCVEVPTTTFGSQSSHTWYGYSSPSYVEYDTDDDGKPKIHQERGISYDIKLDGDTTPMFHWFLEGALPYENNDAPVDPSNAHPPIPNVIVRATVRQGDEISVENVAFNTGEIVAQGQTPPTTLAGAATTTSEYVTYDQYEGRPLYGFHFPLDIKKDTIDKSESYNIRVDAFMDEPLCDGPGSAEGGDYMMADYVLVHTSPDARPRLEWNILNPLYIEALHPQLVGDDLVIHTYSNSPWGSYDVQGDQASEQPMTLEIVGPSPVLSLEEIAKVAHTSAHGLDEHFKPLAITWLWDYQMDQARDGTYTVSLTTRNDQNTAEATAIATFQLGDDALVCAKNIGDSEVQCTGVESVQTSTEAPGVGLAALLAGLVALVVRRR